MLWKSRNNHPSQENPQMSLWLHHIGHLNGGGMLCDEKSAQLESSTYYGVINHRADTLQTTRVFQNVDYEADPENRARS